MHQVYALTVGVTAGPHAIIMEKLKEEAQKSGLDLKVIEFNDFILPNQALDFREIDLNSYQHLPFLEEQVKSRGYKLVPVGKTIVLPMGLYSAKHATISEIKEKAHIAIPNDPTNGGRALKLLEKAKWIMLKPVENPSVLDILENPKDLKITEIDAPQIPRILKDVDYGVVNTDWIVVSGMDPKKALITEDKYSPYANIIVVHQGDEGREDIQKFLSLYHSPVMKKFISEQFKGAAVPAW